MHGFTGQYQKAFEGYDEPQSIPHTVFDSFKQGFLIPNQILPTENIAAKKETQTYIDYVNHELSHPDYGILQKSANLISGWIGTALNPLSIMTGEIGGAVARGITSGTKLVGKFVPSTVTQAITKPIIKSGPEFVTKESIGSLGEKGTAAYFIGAGAMLPYEVAQRHDENLEKFDWWGGIKASSEDGAIGLALGAVPYLSGIIYGKIKKGIPFEEIKAATGSKSKILKEEYIPTPSEAKDNFELHELSNLIPQSIKRGNITVEEGNWLSDMLTSKLSKSEIENKAVQILSKNNHPINSATKEVSLELMSKEDVSSLQNAISDHLSSSVPDDMKNYVTNFVADNATDKVINKAAMIDGLNGVSNFISKRLENKNAEIELLEKMTKDKSSEDVQVLKNKLEAEHTKQEDLKTVLDGIIKTMNSNSGSIANKSNVKSYLLERYSTPNQKPFEYEKDLSSIKNFKDELKNFNLKEESEKPESEIIMNLDNTLSHYENQIHVEAPEINENFSKAKDQLQEFVKSKKIFDQLIMCAQGVLNDFL